MVDTCPIGASATGLDRVSILRAIGADLTIDYTTYDFALVRFLGSKGSGVGGWCSATEACPAPDMSVCGCDCRFEDRIVGLQIGLSV